MDFFKDIFIDGSDDEIPITQIPFKIKESPRKEIIINDQKQINLNEISSEKKESTSNTTHFNLFPPKGIFANLNFDELFTPNKHIANQSENSIVSGNKNQINNKTKSYGPFLPEYEKLTTTYVKIKGTEIKTLEEDEWVEKEESCNNESSHKNKHSKHKKHKKKHKSKKKSHKHE